MENIDRFKELVTKENTGLLKKWKHREKYRLYYNLIFWLKLKWIIYKKG